MEMKQPHKDPEEGFELILLKDSKVMKLKDTHTDLEEDQDGHRLKASEQNYFCYLICAYYPSFNFPYMTAFLVAVNFGIYYLMVWWENEEDCHSATDGEFSSYTFLEWQATDNYLIFYRGQIWRLATAGYIHADWYHMTGNMIYIGLLGIPLEFSLGPW
jgi:membrane associated rhomboid family serine protease